ncbi:transposase family protein [Enterococcus sp. LJL51]|uniref:transposase family protein n=1 Tax=Enterococcus sp. LJL51 TaxID=3416656 RepID=UPI003CF59C99
MKVLFVFLSQVTDSCQANKVVHSLSASVMFVFFDHWANCNEWEESHFFALRNKTILKHFIALENDAPSKDTICRVMGMIYLYRVQCFLQ